MTVVRSGAVLGIEGYVVDVEVDLHFGMQVVHIVGLPASAVREAKLRVPAAIVHAGYRFPPVRLTINLAPAGVRKDGTGFDLPIALGVLLASEQLGAPARDRLARYVIVGELGLGGELRPVRGVLPLALAARDAGALGVVVPAANADEAAVVEGIEVIAAETLGAVCSWARGHLAIAPRRHRSSASRAHTGPCMSEVAGQSLAKRALEIAAAGGHNVLMIGPPGSGKSMLAKRLPTIMAAMSYEEALETTALYSVSGKLDAGASLVWQRPFRAPHHTISDAGLIGGGAGVPRPGELSLAHHGVLFLDELPEFRGRALEAMRQPLEDGEVRLARAQMALTYPSRVMLVAAMNPCRCGYYGYARCGCGADSVRRYRARISGPIRDRIDLHVEVPALSYHELRQATPAEASTAVRARVEVARRRQRRRTGARTNAMLGPRELDRHCALDTQGEAFLATVVERMSLSARAMHRLLKVARTIADLQPEPRDITVDDLAEAAHYRPLEGD